MKEYTKTSASQVKTFTRCQRKWYFEKVLKYKRESSEAMRLGTAIHHALEMYLTPGQVTPDTVRVAENGNVVELGGYSYDVARFVEAAKEYLPESTTPDLLERGIEFEVGDTGVTWRGYIDLITDAGPTDYKTTRDLKWAKSSEYLDTDIQMVSYGYWLAQSCAIGMDETVDLTHLYIETRNKIKVNTREVVTTVTRQHLENEFMKLVPVIEDMKIVYKLEKIENVPANLEACDDFGGCPYRQDCPGAGRESFADKFASWKEGKKC